MSRLSVKLPGLNLKNPIMPASGTFGFGREMSEFYDLSHLGCLITKSVTAAKREGNPTPRLAETQSGLLNSIGLQNPGVDYFINNDLPFLNKFETPIMVNVAGSTEEEYLEVVKALEPFDSIKAIELNVSCPNVSEGGMAFGQDPEVLKSLVAKVKQISSKAIYVKLSPNVTSIQEIALACEAAGADGLTMINTLKGLRMDLNRRQPIIKRGVAGLSGPAIKAVALALVYEVRQVTQLPIIGIGGIETEED
ncbi:MAG TPA: dihydroorotate dehydrogenase, partial [Erysipelothrix sp.]